MSSTQKAIVFGPTGAVGRTAALEARRRGAHVYLAMRDTSKAISGLNFLDTGYTRVQADLSDPASLTRAVEESSATTAFVYCLFTGHNHMASSFAALKDAGIKYVVLLSSFKVAQNARETDMDDFVAAGHAKIEIALEESGLAYAAVRPAYFNSNVLWNLNEIKSGEVGLLYSDVKFDYLAPEDIGAVCGAILVEPSFQKPDRDRGRSKAFYLCGPELLSQQHAHKILAQRLNREIKIKEISEKAWMEKYSYMPSPALEALLKGLRSSHEGYDMYERMYENAVSNVKKYKEAEPMKFEEWVEANKAAFA